jgi:hypothetical protein
MRDPMAAVVEPFLEAIDPVAGAGWSAVLYGSLARGHFVPERSDINLMLVLPALDRATLDGFRAGMERWSTAGYPPPLLFTAAEWIRAQDVYQVELADMLVGYRVLRGPDPLGTARVRAPELRRQLERELRGKLLRLRQGYTLVGDDPAGMGELALRSAPTVLVLLRGVLAMTGAPPAVTPSDVVSGAEAATGLGLQPIGAAAAHRHEPRWECSQQEFLNYTAAVTSVADFVDRFDPGEPR